MPHPFEEYRSKRLEGNEAILKTKNLITKRVFSLDKGTYSDGALSKGTKDLLALVASMVLRCNDCIDYHLEEAVKEGYSLEEIEEAMSVALVVGGTIVIPHMRHAAQSLDFLFGEEKANTES
ncbi:MAG: carboxymuconolactone decarboxylase family protein [Gammaproteobacteria bacterium CG22_combo_CG10-13_8_21_14_all_40_8]|nr:MAG: carboxymuconolactone decarboxylase family protein [Gammaproteobacteria bacterium CG22_combo_CG10-13_8_21_14_all_40_8]